MKRSTQVRYCPGSAPGSPAGMTPERADEQAVKDTHYILKMKGVGALDKNAPLPHVNGECQSCKRS